MATEFMTNGDRAQKSASDHDRLGGGSGQVAARFGPNNAVPTVRVRKGSEPPIVINRTDLAEWTAKGYAVVE